MFVLFKILNWAICFQKLILNSVELENPDYNGNAFVSLSIWYVTFALFLWVVPPIIRFTGIQLAVTLGAIGYR